MKLASSHTNDNNCWPGGTLLSLALLDHSIYPQQFLRLQRRQRVKELVRRSFFHQPPDGLALVSFDMQRSISGSRCALTPQARITGMALCFVSFKSQFALSSAQKKRNATSNEGFFFQVA